MPTGRQKRILSALLLGDLIWEVLGEVYLTQYNEKTGRESRIRRSELEALEAFGWVQRVADDASTAHRLQSWEITERGRYALESESPGISPHSGMSVVTDSPRAGGR